MATDAIPWMTDPTNQTPFFPGFPALDAKSSGPGFTIPPTTSGVSANNLSGSDSGGGGGNAGKIGGALAPLLISLFGPKNTAADKASANSDQLTQMAQSLFSGGKDMTSLGLGALAPVLKYLTSVAGGDLSTLLSATAPERSRIIDQYDTAKRTSATFAPRGGGVTSSMIGLETGKASALATDAASARRSAVGTLGQLGEGLTASGLQAEAQGAQDLNNAITQQMAQAKRQDDQMAALASGLAKAMIGFVL
jgi:hypothetical protein